MSVLPFPSFLDDVKEKGLRRALYEGINNVVERLTAGMNVQDLREALRGDPPSRKPNPRLQPHADGFWLHMRPSYFHKSVTGLYPEFRLGWLSTYFVFFETITGIFLMVWYTPSPEVAYSNMLAIMSNVPLGQFMRDLHRLGAEDELRQRQVVNPADLLDRPVVTLQLDAHSVLVRGATGPAASQAEALRAGAAEGFRFRRESGNRRPAR